MDFLMHKNALNVLYYLHNYIATCIVTVSEIIVCL